MDQSQKAKTIANHVSEALSSFRDLKKSLSRFDTSGEDSKFDSPKDLLSIAEDDFTRFKMWVGNQAAHQSGPASLDHRLREAPHLQQQVIYLLNDMLESLRDSSRLVLGEFETGQEDEASHDDPNDEVESDFSDSDIDDGPSASSLSTLLADVGEAIDCLLRLSVAIANPAPHERFRQLGAGPSEDVSFYEDYDKSRVRDKFPNINEDLAKFLGNFITRRRQFFKYRKAHHLRLVAGLEHMVSDEKTDAGRTEVVPKTVASSLPEQLKAMLNFDPKADVIDEDMRSDTAMSQTSYATSAGFLLNEVHDQLQEPPSPLRVPPLPTASENGIFECPFCYRIISAKSRGAWKRHVFGDLRPYTCLLSTCTESNIDFDRRHNFQSHVLKYHWKSWSCPFKCEGLFPSAAELARHVKAQHLQSGTEDELRAVVPLGEKSAPDDTGNQCLVCGYMVFGVKKYTKHVGRHLEQLALTALPTLDGETELEDVESDEQNSAQSALEANSSQNYSEALSPDLEPPDPIGSGPLDDEEEATGPSGDGHNIEEQTQEHIRAGKQPATSVSSNEDLEAFQTNRDITDTTQDSTDQTEYQRVVSRMAFIEETALTKLRQLKADMSKLRTNEGMEVFESSLISHMALVKKAAHQQIDQLIMEIGGKPSSETAHILRFIATAWQNFQQKMDMIEQESLAEGSGNNSTPLLAIDEATGAQILGADDLANKLPGDTGTFEQAAPRLSPTPSTTSLPLTKDDIEARLGRPVPLETLGPEAEDKASSESEPKTGFDGDELMQHGVIENMAPLENPPTQKNMGSELLDQATENKNVERDDKPDPERIRLEVEIAAFKAMEEKAKAAEKQKEFEEQIRKGAKEAYNLRVKVEKLAQKRARKQIEKASLEAEWAARERIEAARDAEKEVATDAEKEAENKAAAEKYRLELEAIEKETEVIEQEIEELCEATMDAVGRKSN